MSVSIVRNVTANPVTLPPPYRGTIPGGGQLALPDDEDTVIANLGGARAIVSVFDVRRGLDSQQAEAAQNSFTYGVSRRQTIAANGQTIFGTKGMVIDLEASAPRVMSSTPTISPGLDSQIIILINCAPITITLQDEGTLPGSGLKLGAGTRVLDVGDNITLMYHDDLDAWVETAFTNVM